MIKIAITVRNRLEITKKCIEALVRHSSRPHEIYIYDNLTHYKLENHFSLYHGLINDGIIHQVTFNTKESTFDAFSKAAALNQFGHMINDDPKKNDISFLVFLDNDIIVTPEWDNYVFNAWKQIKQKKMNHIKIVGQQPGGIKDRHPCNIEVKGAKTITGKLGGSGFWCVQPNFYDEVGFLKMKQLVGANKRHDQLYWGLLGKAAKGNDYILGIKKPLGIHCGNKAGSVCNVLSYPKRGGTTKEEKFERIKFSKQDDRIGRIPFDEFFNIIKDDQELIKGW